LLILTARMDFMVDSQLALASVQADPLSDDL
jgi:hypothetical protein